MPRLLALLLPILALTAAPIAAQVVTVSETVEVVQPASDGGSERYVATAPANLPRGIASFGPFRVLDRGRAALVDATDAASPAQFEAMLRAYPAIALIEMIECPGTEDDRANLQLGRMIHARGISTHVPADGSVRSGGVELFLAGKNRRADPGAEFAVHSWADEDGREAKDYPASAPENRAYIDYYEELGMPEPQARAFYAMTNSVPNAQAKWLGSADIGRWVHLD